MTPEQASSILTIDLKAITENFQTLQEKVGKSCACGAVLKTDAYGIGAKQVAFTLALAGCDTFFVAHLFEGIELRKTIKSGKIYVLHGTLPKTEPDFVEHNLIPVLSTREQVIAWSKYAQTIGQSLDAALHIDTGMHRLALTQIDVNLFTNSPSLMNGIHLNLVISHLACGDAFSSSSNDEQLALFDRLCQKLSAIKPYPFLKSLSASSGVFLGTPFHKDLVRPGISLYGAIENQGLKPSISLHSKIIQIQDIEKNKPVGYGLVDALKRDGQIATVALGYADGYPRTLSRKGLGFIGNEMARVVGRISMDLLVLDVTDVPEKDLFIGQMVEFIGPNVSLSDLARQTGMLEYEILTNLGRRFYRSYKD